MYRSAVSSQTKRNSLLPEGLRRLRNIFKGSDPNVRIEALTRFMWTLMVSGYDHKYRLTLLQGILKREKEIETEIKNGTRVRFRDRSMITSMKAEKLGRYPDQ